VAVNGEGGEGELIFSGQEDITYHSGKERKGKRIGLVYRVREERMKHHRYFNRGDEEKGPASGDKSHITGGGGGREEGAFIETRGGGGKREQFGNISQSGGKRKSKALGNREGFLLIISENHSLRENGDDCWCPTKEPQSIFARGAFRSLREKKKI